MLNNEQQKAVRSIIGPLLIIAGAGTGKTRVIIEKIKYLLKKKLAKMDEILALTFTDKASYEMEERVDQAMPYGYIQTWISTFHSFADQILKNEIHHIGLTSGYKIMTESESIIFIKKNLFKFKLKYFRPLSTPNKFLNDMLQHFSRLKDEDISPSQYTSWIQSKIKKSKNIDTQEKEELKKNLELTNAYNTYQQLKINQGVLDYSDLIFYLLKLFRQRKSILTKYQKKFKYIFIDEFQDTNIAQYNLIKLLAPAKNNPNLTVVGDDAQAIYKFRGASISNILNFMKDYKKTKQITLTKNYRSNQEILDTAYRLIKHNDPDTLEYQLGISKKLLAIPANNQNQPNQPVELHITQSPEQEADYVIDQILKLKDKYQLSDMAILTRANNHNQLFLQALSRYGIPYQFLGPGLLLKQPEIKDLISLLKFLDNIDDSISLYRLLSMDIFGIDIKDLIHLNVFSKKINQSLFQAIEIYLSYIYKDITIDYQLDLSIYKPFLPLLTKKTQQQLLDIYILLGKLINRTKKNLTSDNLYYFLEKTNILKKLVNFSSEKDEKNALNIIKFFNVIKNFETNNDEVSLSMIVDYLDLQLEFNESPMIDKTDLNLQNAVNIITVHSSKGLEFKVVFLVNLVNNRFPSIHRSDILPIPNELIKETLPSGDYHLQEERRLFYVALTRAKEKIYLTAASYYGQSQKTKKLSTFIIESLDKDQINKALIINDENKLQTTLFDLKPIKKITLQNKSLISQVTTFSYSQIESYNRCPLQYKFNYILKIPTPLTPSLSFGNTIHKTLQLFYQQYKQNQRLGKTTLINLFHQNFIPIGYTSASQEKKTKKSGIKILTNFYKKFHHQKINIIDIEKNFKIKINDYYLTGKIDRVDSLSNNQIEIIDYKTGKQPDSKELAKNLQLAIYSLAANHHSLYNKKFPDIILSLIYLNSEEKISFNKSEEEIKKTQEKITKIIDNIRQFSFVARVGHHCTFCPYRSICDFCK